MRKPMFWFPTRSDTNQAVQLQKMARGLKIRIKKVEVLYYLCSENKGADQLRGPCEADLCLCFCICKMLVFSERGLHQTVSHAYALVICNHGPQPRRRAGDILGKMLCFYFSIVPTVPRKYQEFVLYGQIWQCNENITDCRGKGLWFY